MTNLKVWKMFCVTRWPVKHAFLWTNITNSEAWRETAWDWTKTYITQLTIIMKNFNFFSSFMAPHTKKLSARTHDVICQGCIVGFSKNDFITFTMNLLYSILSYMIYISLHPFCSFLLICVFSTKLHIKQGWFRSRV